MFICDKGYHCCDYQYCDTWDEAQMVSDECVLLTEVQPVIHAEWLKQPLEKHPEETVDVCSNCSTRALASYNYCPNCGARMKNDNG